MALDIPYKTKIDVIDLIINILREHEKALNEAVERLEAIYEHLSMRGDEFIMKPRAEELKGRG